MHNNGSNRLILPERGPLLPNLTPPSGVRFAIGPGAIVMTAFLGDLSVDVPMTPEQATQLGVNAISVGAIVHNMQVQAQQQQPSPIINTEPESNVP